MGILVAVLATLARLVRPTRGLHNAPWHDRPNRPAHDTPEPRPAGPGSIRIPSYTGRHEAPPAPTWNVVDPAALGSPVAVVRGCYVHHEQQREQHATVPRQRHGGHDHRTTAAHA
ncbi:hypothetical protein NORO109296_08040 [Nocardiopsis rhodophaea]